MEAWGEVPCLGQAFGLSSAGRFGKDHNTLPPMAATPVVLYLWCTSGKCLILLGEREYQNRLVVVILRRRYIQPMERGQISSEPHRHSLGPIQKIIEVSTLRACY